MYTDDRHLLTVILLYVQYNKIFNSDMTQTETHKQKNGIVATGEEVRHWRGN